MFSDFFPQKLHLLPNSWTELGAVSTLVPGSTNLCETFISGPGKTKHITTDSETFYKSYDKF